MTPFEYVLNFALVGLVLLQVKGRTLTARNLLAPVLVTGWVAYSFLKSIPTAGNDLVLEAGLATAGAVLGTLAALATRVSRDHRGLAFAKAGGAAAVLWVVGIGARIAFSLYAQNGGQGSVARFSIAHHITDAHAWGAAFVLMAIAEVVTRTGVVFVKARLAGAAIPRKVGAPTGAPVAPVAA
jgi:hypothetical protein